MILTAPIRRNLLVMAKELTREQAETKKHQAAELMERTGQSDRADEFRSMSVEEYADHRGLRLTNPRSKGGFMPHESKAELTDRMDEIESLIDEALDAELTREEVIQKIKEMRDVVEGEEEEEDASCDDDEEDLESDDTDEEDDDRD